MTDKAPIHEHVKLDIDRFQPVIFDMDGVITDTANVHFMAWKRTFDQFLLMQAHRERPFDATDYYRHVDGKPREEGVASFLASRGIVLPRGRPDSAPGERSIWAIANSKNREFERIVAESGVRAFPSSVALVGHLQAMGVSTAIISGSRNCGEILVAAGVGDLFPVRVDGIEAARLGLPGKPDPAVFIEASRRLGVLPEVAVVVEDALAGVEAGRAGSFGLVIGVDRTDARRQELLAHGADVVVRDLGHIDLVGHGRMDLTA